MPFFLIGKCDYGVDHNTLRNVIARWFFMVALTGRYSGSFESIMEQDLNRFREVKDGDGFTALLDQIISNTFTEDFWNITLPTNLATSASRGPSLFAYYASLVNLNANVLFSQLSVADLLEPCNESKKICD